MARLAKRVWDHRALTVETKCRVYQACVLSPLLYGSETWTAYSRQERRLNTFHMRCLKRLFNIDWKERITHEQILKRAKLPSLQALLSQRRLRWLGHVWRMDDGRMPKDILYGQLVKGSRKQGRPFLRFKDVCKRDMRICSIATDTWESDANDRTSWRQRLIQGIADADQKRFSSAAEKRDRRKQSSSAELPSSVFICPQCNRDCHSRIGLFSHNKKCR